MSALAAVTGGLTQLLSATLALGLAYYALSSGNSPLGAGFDPFDWIRSSAAILLVTAATAVVLIWQYGQRTTIRSRWLILAVSIAVAFASRLIPWTTEFAIQSQLSSQQLSAASINVAFDSDRKWLARASAGRNDRVDIQLPRKITPKNMPYQVEGLSLGIDAPDGSTWRSDDKAERQINLEGGIPSIETTIEGSLYRKIKDTPVKLRGALYLTFMSNAGHAAVSFENAPVAVAGVGECTAEKKDLGRENESAVMGGNRSVVQKRRYGYSLFCQSAFRSPPDYLSVFFEHSGDLFREAVSYSPFPAELTFNPVIQSN
jgi:hypothetical protein